MTITDARRRELYYDPHLRMPPECREMLESIAERTGEPLSTVVARLIREAHQRAKRKAMP